jgi:hypothetical protein
MVLFFVGRDLMTVCVAVLFNWNYAAAGEPAKFARAAVTAADRMLTAGDVQYEPQQQKAAFFGKSMILVAGDIGIHSQAIRDAAKEIRERDLPPYDVAQIFGRAVQSINRRQAENEILAPLGLNTDTFHAQQKEFSADFVASITSQLQNRRPVDTEALVVGSDGEEAHIYHVDAFGSETCLDGVGFGAIGIGAWHAKSRLMQLGHTPSTRYWAHALASVFAAKKGAEISPGVGKYTDLQIILKDRVYRVSEHVPPELLKLYEKYRAEAAKLGDQMVAELDIFLATPPPQAEVSKDEVSEKDAQANVGAGAIAANVSQVNEESGEKDDRNAAE